MRNEIYPAKQKQDSEKIGYSNTAQLFNVKG